MIRHTGIKILPMVLAVGAAWAEDGNHEAVEHGQIAPVVVTATRQEKANVVKFDPKASIQPLPAGDGADLLRAVPNMSVTRKSGSSGDPLFRGLGGSRLIIQADDQLIFGGCGGRMDPPTAYIFPSTYDEVIITKGPQSVTQGPGQVAGSVRFVRKQNDFTEKQTYLNSSLTLGSNDRRDGHLEGAVGGKYGYARLNIAHNESDDYKDGSGNRVHSSFKRDSQILQLGVTPTENTDIAGTYERSRGEAAYADRMMDGIKFDRDAWNIRATQRNLTDWLSSVEISYGQSEVDHVMDNYSLRTSADTNKRANNPKRNTDTARLKAVMDWDNVNVQTGADYMRDKHSFRGGVDYAQKPYAPNQNFRQWGIFTEAAWQRTPAQKWTAGYRHDQVKAEYDSYPDSDPAKKQTYRLDSGFVRWEQTAGGLKYYAGAGIAERSPDFWERNRSKDLKPEQNRQLDAGVIWQNSNWHASVSVFGSDVRDFILVDNNVGAHNIDATRFGGEAEVQWKFAPNWELGSSLAYTRGKNRTDGLALAQTPPLEWRNSLTWDNGKFSAGGLWRVVAAQKRYAVGQGNIIGQDLGASGGFGVFSLNGGWKINKHATLQGGIDNVFDKSYAEFVSRSGSHIDPDAGIRTTRVNEPGRQLWLRLLAQW